MTKFDLFVKAFAKKSGMPEQEAKTAILKEWPWLKDFISGKDIPEDMADRLLEKVQEKNPSFVETMEEGHVKP